MKLVAIADSRSENFRRFIQYFIDNNDDVYILSTYACQPIGNSKLVILPSIFGGSDVFTKKVLEKQEKTGLASRLINFFVKTKVIRFMYLLWGIVKTVNVPIQSIVARKHLKRIKPDLLIAFRTQNEGYVAALSQYYPWVLFTQGSDFIDVANKSPWHGWLTSLTVSRVNGLLSDCQRDINWAKYYGLAKESKVGLYPGNGGVNLFVFKPGQSAASRSRLVVCPRSPAPYIRTDTIIRSIYQLQQLPEYGDIKFVFISALRATSIIYDELSRFNLDKSKIEIIPYLPQDDLAELLRRAAVIISPSLTDGTPNSMLEAMACGAFPIMSNLESVQEWIIHGKNGFLFDPNSYQALVECLKSALDDEELRYFSQIENLEIIQKRADYQKVMPEIRKFLISMVKSQ